MMHHSSPALESPVRIPHLTLAGALTDNGARMSEPMTPSIGRCDLLPSALIFGGLFIALTAVGGALEGSSGHWVEEIKVVAGEDLVGNDEMDTQGTCKKTDKNGQPFGDVARNCRQTQLVVAPAN